MALCLSSRLALTYKIKNCSPSQTVDVWKASPAKYLDHYETKSYQAVLQDLVEAVVKSAHRQKVDYDRHSAERPFRSGDLVGLSVPTAGKLDP